MTGNGEGVGLGCDDQAQDEDGGMVLTLNPWMSGFSSELVVTIPGFSTRIIFATMSIRITKMVRIEWTKMRNLRESKIGDPSYGFNNRLVSEDPPELEEIISWISAGGFSRHRPAERPGHLSLDQLCLIAIARGVLLDAVIAISFSTVWPIVSNCDSWRCHTRRCYSHIIFYVDWSVVHGSMWT